MKQMTEMSSEKITGVDSLPCGISLIKTRLCRLLFT